MRITFWVIFLLSLLGFSDEASEDPILAKIGLDVLRVSDVLDAYPDSVLAETATMEGRQRLLEDLIHRHLLERAAFARYPEPPIRQRRRLQRVRESLLRTLAGNRLVAQRILITPAMKDTLWNNWHRERHLMAMLILERETAYRVYDQLQAGESFGDLAEMHSVQWIGEGKGGDLGWQRAGLLPWGVDTAVWAAHVGEIVGPLVQPRGYYVVSVIAERSVEPPATRADADFLLDETIRMPLHFECQKAMLDSLRKAENVHYPPSGLDLLQSKYSWEGVTGDPLEHLKVPRTRPMFTAEEETTLAVTFTTTPDWTASEFADRLDWYATGLWPRGDNEGQLIDVLDMVVRDFLLLKAALDLRLDQDPEFLRLMDERTREMRVTYFYHHDVIGDFQPTEEQIRNFFHEHRETYRIPAAYQVEVFSSKNDSLMTEVALQWKEGMPLWLIRAKSVAFDPRMRSMPERKTVYAGQDPAIDAILEDLDAGEISEPFLSDGVAWVYRLLSQQSSRLPEYGEVEEAVVNDATTWLRDGLLNEFLANERERVGVELYMDALRDASWDVVRSR